MRVYWIVQLFVIEGDYIYLREGAHAKVSATTAVAKAAAAAAAASPAGLDRPPVVAVTPVAQVAQLQRGKAAKAPNKDVRPQSQQDEPNILTQRSISPQQSKSGNIRQISASFVPRNSVGTVVAASNNEGKLDGIGNTSDGEFSSNNLPTGKNSDVTDNGEANGFGNSRVGNHGNRQQNRFVTLPASVQCLISHIVSCVGILSSILLVIVKFRGTVGLILIDSSVLHDSFQRRSKSKEYFSSVTVFLLLKLMLVL